VRLPQPGEAVGPYTCLRLLASGGMGAVYEARHPDLPRNVALKLLLAPEDPELVARFHREAEACGRLSHPNLVRVHGSGVGGQACYLVMELVPGESLQALLDQGEDSIPPERARAWIAQAAAGVAHAHRAGVLHRDLKPSNLLWDRELERICVVDFGLTGRLSAADSLTATGEVLGTPGYLAPEQVGAFEGKTDARTDVYGLGATLFALLAGRPPFLGTGLAGLAAVATDSAPDLRSLRADLDPDLAGLVAGCLQKDPALRPSSAEEVLSVLAGRAWVAGNVSSRRNRRRVTVALGAGLLFSLLGGGAALQAAGAGRRKAEAYGAWRAAAGSGFAYGWGEVPPEFAESLASWEADLEAHPAPGQEAWRAARRDIRAQGRVLAALRGQDPGASKADLKPGPEDHLAQAVVDLRAGRTQDAAAAFAGVEGPLSRSPAARLTRSALEARLEPRRFLGSLGARSATEREALRSQFPAALAALAPDASIEDLLRWYEFAQGEGWEGAAALKAAIVSSPARRRAELERLPNSERAIYLRRLCGPLRAAGLWPDSGFQAACKEVFWKELRALVALDHGSKRRQGVRELVHIEHEMFYRVEATPIWGTEYRKVLNEPDRSLLDSTLERALHRYASHPGGFRLKGSLEGISAILAERPEPGSALDRAYDWWKKYGPGRAGEPSARQALEDLERLLTTGVLDLPPSLSVELFYALENTWGRRAPGDAAAREAEVRSLAALAKAEFERTLPWATNLPRKNLATSLSRFAMHQIRPYLGLEPRDPRHLKLALANFDASAACLLGAERAVSDSAGEVPLLGEGGYSAEMVFSESVAMLYSDLANYARLGSVLPEVLSRLLSQSERMAKRADTNSEFVLYWTGVVAGLRVAQPDRAVAAIEEHRLDERAQRPVLALELAYVLAGTPEAKRALPALRRALVHLDSIESQLTHEELRGKLNEYIEACSR